MAGRVAGNVMVVVVPRAVVGKWTCGEAVQGGWVGGGFRVYPNPKGSCGEDAAPGRAHIPGQCT